MNSRYLIGSKKNLMPECLFYAILSPLKPISHLAHLSASKFSFILVFLASKAHQSAANNGASKKLFFHEQPYQSN